MGACNFIWGNFEIQGGCSAKFISIKSVSFTKDRITDIDNQIKPINFK